MAGRLEGKVAIVTGGSTGIGEAICKRFAQEGACVVVNGLPGDPVEQVVQEIGATGGRAAGFVGDIADPVEAERCVGTAVAEFGKLDILVNNAGVFPEENMTENYSLDAVEQLIHTNIRGTFVMTKAAIPQLKESHGCIVSAGSESGIIGMSYFSPYGGTKAFVHAFMMGVSQELARYGVRANCVCPGPIDTSWTRASHGHMTAKTEEMAISAVPLGRLGHPEEVANVYVFLASDEASYVTGSLYRVDGGITTAHSAAGMLVPPWRKGQPDGTVDLKHQHEGRAELR